MEDVRIKLSVLWMAHFLIWTFGDVARLLHPGYIEELIDEPISEDLLLFVAVPLAIIQTVMILLPVMWDEGKIIRWANIAVGILYLVINVGYVIDIYVSEMPSWEYLLAVVYIVIAALVIKTAWEWIPELKPE